MSEPTLIEFLMSVLRGIQYGNLSTTSRAYQWMKNNNNFDGPCLNALKNYITKENILSQKEMEMYQKLEKKGDLLTEEELDIELAMYYDDRLHNELETIDIESYTDVLENSQNYLKELNLAAKLLERKKSDIEVEINQAEKKNQVDESKKEDILRRSDQVNLLYNETIKKVQQEFSKISLNFNKLLNEDSNEQHNVFRINFEVLKQINSKFRETVDTVIQKQFGKPQKVDLVENKNSCKSELSSGQGVDYSKKGYLDVNEEKNKIETLIKIAHCLGERNFHNVKLKCEETEFKQLNDFLENLLLDFKCKNVISMGNARLQSQTAINLETVDDIQKQLSIVSQNLEKYYKINILNEIFASERFRIEHKLESDKKRLTKISDLCSKFVGLLTLQGFLFQNEKENVDLAVDIYDQGVAELESQYEKHSNVMFNLKIISQNQDTKEKLNENVGSLYKFSSSFLQPEEVLQQDNILETLEKYPSLVGKLQNEVLIALDNKLELFTTLKNSLESLDKILFNGPARQPFYVDDLLNDKILIELRWNEFNKMFRIVKKNYKDEMDKLSTDQYVKIEKSLWILFMIDPQALQDNYKMLKENAGVNKTLIMKKTNNSSVVSKKPYLSSYY